MILPNININSNGVIEENKAFIQIKLTSILEEWNKRVSEEEKNLLLMLYIGFVNAIVEMKKLCLEQV